MRGTRIAVVTAAAAGAATAAPPRWQHGVVTSYACDWQRGRVCATDVDGGVSTPWQQFAFTAAQVRLVRDVRVCDAASDANDKDNNKSDDDDECAGQCTAVQLCVGTRVRFRVAPLSSSRQRHGTTTAAVAAAVPSCACVCVQHSIVDDGSGGAARDAVTYTHHATRYTRGAAFLAPAHTTHRRRRRRTAAARVDADAWAAWRAHTTTLARDAHTRRRSMHMSSGHHAGEDDNDGSGCGSESLLRQMWRTSRAHVMASCTACDEAAHAGFVTEE